MCVVGNMHTRSLTSMSRFARYYTITPSPLSSTEGTKTTPEQEREERDEASLKHTPDDEADLPTTPDNSSTRYGGLGGTRESIIQNEKSEEIVRDNKGKDRQ